MTARVGPDRFPALDGLRGLAALAIVATHTGFASGRSGRHDLLAAALGRMDFGVAVFFLLSGFLLYRPYSYPPGSGRPRPGAGGFWTRRALRIFPAAWVTVAVVLGVISTRPATSQDWWQYLALVHVYDHHEVDPNLTQLWTLSAEIAFYALIPVLGALAAYRVRASFERQLGIIGVLATLGVGFNVFQSVFLSHNQAQLWLPAYLDWFALGMLLAVVSSGQPTHGPTRVLVVTLRSWAGAPGTCYLVSGLCWSLTLTQLGTPRTVTLATFWQWTAQHLLFGFAAFFLLLPSVLGSSRTAADRVLGSRVGQFLGRISYGVYLWHLALLLLIQRELGFTQFAGHFWLLLLLTTLASVAVASASWYLLERPVLRYGSRLLSARRTAPAPATITTAASVNS